MRGRAEIRDTGNNPDQCLTVRRYGTPGNARSEAAEKKGKVKIEIAIAWRHGRTAGDE